MTAVTPTDRPKSVRRRCVIDVFGGVFYVFKLLFRFFCECSGFWHRTESDLFLFLLSQSQCESLMDAHTDGLSESLLYSVYNPSLNYKYCHKPIYRYPPSQLLVHLYHVLVYILSSYAVARTKVRSLGLLCMDSNDSYCRIPLQTIPDGWLRITNYFKHNLDTMSDFNVETTSDFNVATTSDFNVETTSDVNA